MWVISKQVSESWLKWGELTPAVSWHYLWRSPAATGGYTIHLLLPQRGVRRRDTESINSFCKIFMLINHVPTSEGLCGEVCRICLKNTFGGSLSHASWLQVLLPAPFLAKPLWCRWADHHEWPTGSWGWGMLRTSVDHLSMVLLLDYCLISVNRKEHTANNYKIPVNYKHL